VKSLDYYMQLNYHVQVVRDEAEGGYVVSIPDLKGCLTCADDIVTGFSKLEDAKKEWLKAALEEGYDIPEPGSSDAYSGQFKLRIPKTLHRELAQRSKQEGISMNQYCLYLLAKNSEPQTPRRSRFTSLSRESGKR
jgi:predicted RNase H-like HicB family nuclease